MFNIAIPIIPIGFRADTFYIDRFCSDRFHTDTFHTDMFCLCTEKKPSTLSTLWLSPSEDNDEVLVSTSSQNSQNYRKSQKIYKKLFVMSRNTVIVHKQKQRKQITFPNLHTSKIARSFVTTI